MKWAIREAVDVYFKAKSQFKLGARTMRAGEPVLIFDTVKTSTLEVAAEVSYVTGGRGNSRILSYEGDKTLTFNFEDALLSNEGLAILSGADLIPARNKHLPGAAAEARSVIAHYTEKFSVTRNNVIDADETNIYDDDPSLYPPGYLGFDNPNNTATPKVFDYSPRGGVRNVWLTRKPYVGQNASIYVMLLDDAGEMSGAPLEVNLQNDDSDNGRSYLAKFKAGDAFVAFGLNGLPMAVRKPEENTITRKYEKAGDKASADKNDTIVGDVYPDPKTLEQAGIFDDQVLHYVDLESAKKNWVTAWSNIDNYIRVITAGTYGNNWGEILDGNKATVTVPPVLSTDEAYTFEVPAATGAGYYSYLLAPSGGIAQPKAFKEGAAFYYELNIPSILYQDIVLLDYYVEYRHDATQVSILPDKFGPYLYVEGSSLVRRASDGTDLPVEFVIPKFKVTTALTFTLQSTGDPSTFNFQGDAYPDFSKFDLTRKVLADIQILDADDNYDGTGTGATADPTSYRRYKYNNDSDGEYLWKDPSLEPHSNLDYSDTYDSHVINPNESYLDTVGGPATRTAGEGLIDTAARAGIIDGADAAMSGTFTQVQANGDSEWKAKGYARPYTQGVPRGATTDGHAAARYPDDYPAENTNTQPDGNAATGDGTQEP